MMSAKEVQITTMLTERELIGGNSLNSVNISNERWRSLAEQWNGVFSGPPIQSQCQQILLLHIPVQHTSKQASRQNLLAKVVAVQPFAGYQNFAPHY